MVRALTRFAPALVLVRFADEWLGFFPFGSIEAIRRDLDLSYAAAGVLLALPGFAGLFEWPVTIAADFVDRRVLAVGGALAFAASQVAFALGGSLPILGPAAFLFGIASGAMCNAVEIALVERHRDEADAAVARVTVASTVGDLLGPVTVAATVAAGLHWRWLFAGSAVLMAAYALWLSRQDLPAPARPERSPLHAVRTVVRDRRVWALALIEGLFSALDEPLLGFTSAHLQQTRSPGAAAGIVVVIVASSVAGAAATGRLRRRNGRTALMRRCAATMTASIAVIAFAPWTPAVLAAAAAFGASAAVFWAVFAATALTLIPGLAGTTGAVIALIAVFSDAVPPLAGAIADRAGLSWAIALYAAIAAAVWALVSRRQRS